MQQTMMSAQCPVSLVKQAETAAFLLGVSRSEVLRRAVSDYVGRLKLPDIPTLPNVQARQPEGGKGNDL